MERNIVIYINSWGQKYNYNKQTIGTFSNSLYSLYIYKHNTSSSSFKTLRGRPPPPPTLSMLFSPHPKPDPFFPGRNSGGGRRQWRQRWSFYPRLLYPSVPSIVFLSKNKQHHHVLLSFSAFSGGNRRRTAVNGFGVRWVLLVLLVLLFLSNFGYSSPIRNFTNQN